MGDDRRARHNTQLWLVLLLSAGIVVLGVANYRGLIHGLGFQLGPFYFGHWLAIAAASYIAIVVPVQRYLMSHYPAKRRALMAYHIYGNLLAVGFISIHFTQQLSRTPEEFPNLGTGLALYLALALLVLTGILLRFGFVGHHRADWRWIHAGASLTFYVVIIFHVLHALNVT